VAPQSLRARANSANPQKNGDEEEKSLFLNYPSKGWKKSIQSIERKSKPKDRKNSLLSGFRFRVATTVSFGGPAVVGQFHEGTMYKEAKNYGFLTELGTPTLKLLKV